MIFAVAIPIAEAIAPYVVPAAVGTLGALAAWVGLSDKEGCEVPQIDLGLEPKRQPVPIPVDHRYTAHLLAAATEITALQFQRSADGVMNPSFRRPAGSPSKNSSKTPNPLEVLGSLAAVGAAIVFAAVKQDGVVIETPPNPAEIPSPANVIRADGESDYDAILRICQDHLMGPALMKTVHDVKGGGHRFNSITATRLLYRSWLGTGAILPDAVRYLRELGVECVDPRRLTPKHCSDIVKIASIIREAEKLEPHTNTADGEVHFRYRINTLVHKARLESVAMTDAGRRMTIELASVLEAIKKWAWPHEITQRLKEELRDYVVMSCWYIYD